MTLLPNAPFTLQRGRIRYQASRIRITKLPEAEHEAPAWQAAIEALILVAENGGPTMLARIGVMRALNRHVQRGVQPPHLWRWLREIEGKSAAPGQIESPGPARSAWSILRGRRQLTTGAALGGSKMNEAAN
jgi:hypothetical protein